MLNSFNLLKSIILLCFVCCHFLHSHQTYAQQNKAEVKFYIFPSEQENGGHYLLADSVIMRKCDTANCAAVAMLSIGEHLVLLEAGQWETINGISSPWYKIKTANYEGWIWGGFIATSAFGSEAHNSTKFVTGYHHTEQREGKLRKYYQIRAFIGKQQLDKMIIPLDSVKHVWSTKSIGNAGVKGLDDILTLSLNYDQDRKHNKVKLIIFWDGYKFHYVDKLIHKGGYTAPAPDLSQRFIYPIDMDGVDNHIIKETRTAMDKLEATQTSIQAKREYFIWKNNKLQLVQLKR